MERAKTLERPSGLLQPDPFANDIDNTGLLSNYANIVVVKTSQRPSLPDTNRDTAMM